MSSDYIWSRQHRALVLPIDEKSSIQVLSRSQPVLPMRAEQLEPAAPMITSATTLPVRLRIWNIPSCNVLGKSHYRHLSPSVEFLDFPKHNRCGSSH